ncbi:MAG TPA: DUF4282 domain-containing protein [Fluviicoccus sp.]|nr:DUF4282 domain-containing protein [Fluviicoccus sp.]
MKRVVSSLHAMRIYLQTLLFDIRFDRYISLQIIPLVYLLVLVVSPPALAWLVWLAFGFGTATGLAAVFLAPFVFLAWVSCCRVVLELLIVVFRITDQLDEVAVMRESVDKLSTLSEVTVFTRPLTRFLKPASVRDRDRPPPSGPGSRR